MINKYKNIVWVWFICAVGLSAEKITMEMIRTHYISQVSSPINQTEHKTSNIDTATEKYVNAFIHAYLSNDMDTMNIMATQETIIQLQHADKKIQKVFQQIKKCAPIVPINTSEAKVICGSSRQSMNIEFSLLWWKDRWIIAGVN